VPAPELEISTPRGQTMKPVNEKPSHNEDEYFVKLDAELIKAQRARLDEQRRKAERQQHFMKCPKCGGDLQEIEYGNIKIDKCVECGGAWLDKGEMEMVLHTSEEGGVRRIVRDLLGLKLR
jgi:hypothetical protein